MATLVTDALFQVVDVVLVLVAKFAQVQVGLLYFQRPYKHCVQVVGEQETALLVGADKTFLPISTKEVGSLDFLLHRHALFLCFKELQPHVSGAGVNHTFPIGDTLCVAVGASIRNGIVAYGVSHRIVISRDY